MLRWRSSSNQTCSWQSARHRKETGRCGTAKMGMKTGLVLWGISPVLYYGFSQLSTSEFLKREMEMHETKNHLLCGWCNKCL